MKTRYWLAVCAAALVTDVYALSTPKASDGPIRLLSCTVSPSGVLEARVDNQGDDAMFCNIRCSYEIGEKTFSHSFSDTIPRHFQGSIGRFDTNGARAGNFPGEVGTCKKVSG